MELQEFKFKDCERVQISLMNVFVCITLNAQERKKLLSLSTDFDFFIHKEFSEDAPPHPDFLNSSICFGNVPAHWLECHPKLEWIQLISVGFGEYLEIDRNRLSPKFSMTNLKGFFAEPVAQSMLAGLLSLFRGIDQFSVLKDQTKWVGDPIREQLKSLKNANVLLYGYGSINQEFERLLVPFDCSVNVINSSNSLNELDQTLSHADVVASVVPDHPNTRNVFNLKRLKQMKSSSVFLNFGRGSVTDEDALSHCLMKGMIGGAVIDVTNQEPLPHDHAFWKCPRTIITQHSAGGTEDEISKKISWFSKNLKHFIKGENLISTVDFELGF